MLALLQNWRRRKYCMRCCPFSDGNAGSNVPSILASPPSRSTPPGMPLAPISAPVCPTGFGTPLRYPGHPLLAGPYRFGLPGVASGSPPLPLFGGFQSGPGANGSLPPPALAHILAGPPFMPGPYVPHAPMASLPVQMPTSAASVTELPPTRPLTPSPTGSQTSGCSFAFSAMSVADSPSTVATSPTVSSVDGDNSPVAKDSEMFETERVASDTQAAL